MIKTFRHKGLEAFYKTGSLAGIQPKHAARLREQLTALSVAREPADLKRPGWRLHGLVGDRSGYWSLTVQANWRVVFRFDDTDVELVDYLDYH
ncbi:MAG: type II toxin-antitoxin system RelE/ParE family toxin [Gallionella sp.]|nr:type II toxin-antitoxin system RelE/ParE family toxin [Gallionella sp.]